MKHKFCGDLNVNFFYKEILLTHLKSYCMPAIGLTLAGRITVRRETKTTQTLFYLCFSSFCLLKMSKKVIK